jgi:hypothetical protein
MFNLGIFSARLTNLDKQLVDLEGFAKVATRVLKASISGLMSEAVSMITLCVGQLRSDPGRTGMQKSSALVHSARPWVQWAVFTRILGDRKAVQILVQTVRWRRQTRNPSQAPHKRYPPFLSIKKRLEHLIVSTCNSLILSKLK